MSPAILALADRLASAGKIHVSDQALAGYGRRFKVDFDDARKAAIVADRLRRQRQAAERRNGFHTEPLPPDAPIVLVDKKDRRRGVA